MFVGDDSLVIAVLLRLAHAGAYLGLGGIWGWSLGRERGAKSEQILVSATQRPQPAGLDSKRAEALLTQLYGLTTDVAHGVGEHSSHVAAVGRELTTLMNETDGGKVAPVVQAVASLLQANARLEEQLAHASEKMQQQAQEIETQLADAMTDPLTGIPNRRAFSQEMARRIPEFKRVGTHLSLIMLDVDFFKKFNDTHGHQAGDQVLRGVAGVLRATVRGMDLPVRFGGEEFAAILPTANLEVAKQVAERIRQAIEETRFQFSDVTLQVTASVGLAQIRAGDDEASLIQRADQALYAAKKAGRNNTHYHDGNICLPIAKIDFSAGHEGNHKIGAPVAKERPAAKVESRAGFPNRDDFTKELERRLARGAAEGSQISVVLVEIDGAHNGPDRATQAAAMDNLQNAMGQSLRERDMVAVVGPAVLAAILTGKNATAAVETADIVNSRFVNANIGGARQSLSFGIAEGGNQDRWTTVLARAEEALACSKAGGGNQLHFHTDKTRQPMLADLQVISANH